MKSEITSVENFDFPKLMILKAHQNKVVFLAQDRDNGVVLHAVNNCGFKVGSGVTGVTLQDCEEFTGTLKLSNN